jgi:hypothetical protein
MPTEHFPTLPQVGRIVTCDITSAIFTWIVTFRPYSYEASWGKFVTDHLELPGGSSFISSHCYFPSSIRNIHKLFCTTTSKWTFGHLWHYLRPLSLWHLVTQTHSQNSVPGLCILYRFFPPCQTGCRSTRQTRYNWQCSRAIQTKIKAKVSYMGQMIRGRFILRENIHMLV